MPPQKNTYQNHDLLRRAWAVLTQTAREQRTIAYSELAMALGMPHRRRSIHRVVVSPLCTLVCRPNGFPDIAALVVRKDTREPGHGWWPASGSGPHLRDLWLDELRSVHAFPWPKDLPG